MSDATIGMSAESLPRASLTAWGRHLLALGLVMGVLLMLFGHDVDGMAAIWWNSSTYEHCLVILPIIGWLISQRLEALRTVEPRGWAVPLGWVALGAFAWLLGEAAGVAVARHLGVVMMVQGAVAAMLGRGATAGLLFPLFYAFFLVPFGDATMPALQTITARICLALLHLLHIPATIDGVFIATPGGWFKVAEACSGAKFLVAMIALGVLVAHLGFLRWRRRALFLLACVIVPVFANGLRAFSTIWVAQYRGTAAAGSFDHVVYGWIFFGIVIAIVLAISWRFFDRPADDPAVDLSVVQDQAQRQRSAVPLAVSVLAVLVIAGAAPLWSRMVTARGETPVSASRLPDPRGWVRIEAVDGTPWRPRFDGADQLLTARYRDATGAEVDLAAALYASQGEGRTLVGFGHGAVDPDGVWSWAADLPAPVDGLAERIVAPGQIARTVVSFYRVGDLVTGSPARVKLETLRHHLVGGPQGAQALLVSAQEGQGGRAAVDRFLAVLGPPGAVLDQIAQGR